MRTFVILLLCYFVTLFASPVFAASAFDADYDVDYSVAPSGVTIVTQKVTLTNKETNLYPKQYSVAIDSSKIRNVIARDTAGLITPAIVQKDGKTTIGLTFNDQIVGLGRQTSFTLRYENLEIASKNGSIWEIYVPGVADDEALQSYTVSLAVPSTFGPLAYRTPAPADGRHWNKTQMIHGGIAAAYGNSQTFAVQLGYFLSNPRVTPVKEEIALPPDTAYQKVLVQSLNPKPVTVRRDDDGNWLATYELSGGQKVHVLAKLLVSLTLGPRPGWKDAIIAENFTKPLQYWESGDPTITQLAKQFTTPQAIYQHVVNTLSYNYDRVNQNPVRRGAAAALTTPKEAICMEFTDLFIALARAAGIPAREIVGFAYTTNTRLRPLSLVADVLHSWPEYYDKEKEVWVPVDPTWGNTTGGVDYFNKLDFNHIAFAIHGLSSTYPYPAGAYREENKQGKDVDVTFAEAPPQEINGKLTTTIQFPATATAGRVASGKVVVTNDSGVAVESADITIAATPFPFSFTDHQTRIPPLASFAYPVDVPIASFIARGTGRISATVNGQLQEHIFTIAPMYWLLLPVFGIILACLFLIWFFVHGHSAKKS
ncbi:hypothetical protein HY086_03245 [Candidatus Gottesmanbacteria bacterium]|nr:hypothetical protein [Candidatus Gottesmanbacteria bacterium]